MNLENFQTLGNKKRKVHFHGALGDKFGASYDLCVRSPAEAIRLMEANFPGEFAKFIAQEDCEWRVVLGNPDTPSAMDLSVELVPFQFPSVDIHFIPVPKGAGGGTRGKGTILAIVGIALIATAVIGAGGFGALFSGSGGTAFALGGVSITWGNIGMLGLALLLLGVAILLAPQPKTDPTTVSGLPSFFFSGATNTQREGVPVPLCYGRILAGSVVVHSGISDTAYDIHAMVMPPSSFDTSGAGTSLLFPNPPAISSVSNGGAIANGGTTTHQVLIVRLSLVGTTAVVGSILQLYDAFSAIGTPYTLLTGDVVAGFVDITTPTLADHHIYSFNGTVQTAGGLSAHSVSDYSVGVSTDGVGGPAPHVGVIFALNGVTPGVNQAIAPDATTDATDIKLRITFNATGAKVGDIIHLYNDVTLVVNYTLILADITASYTEITRTGLAAATYKFNATITTSLGLSIPSTPNYTITT